LPAHNARPIPLRNNFWELHTTSLKNSYLKISMLHKEIKLKVNAKHLRRRLMCGAQFDLLLSNLVCIPNCNATRVGCCGVALSGSAPAVHRLK